MYSEEDWRQVDVQESFKRCAKFANDNSWSLLVYLMILKFLLQTIHNFIVLLWLWAKKTPPTQKKKTTQILPSFPIQH